MDGLKINGVTLFLGKIPNRKQECFYFAEGATLYPVAYISSENLVTAKRLWGQMLPPVEYRYKIPETEEEQTERSVDELLDKEHNLAIQNCIAPDLT